MKRQPGADTIETFGDAVEVDIHVNCFLGDRFFVCGIAMHPSFELYAEEVARVSFDFIGVFIEEDLAE